MFNLLNDILNNPAMILLLIIIVFGLIALLVFFIRKLMFKNKKDDKPDDETIVKENLDRYLEDVEDEATQKEFDKFEDSNKEDK